MSEVKIIQFMAMSNNMTYQGCILGLGDDGVIYIAGSQGWETYIDNTFKPVNNG